MKLTREDNIIQDALRPVPQRQRTGQADHPRLVLGPPLRTSLVEAAGSRDMGLRVALASVSPLADDLSHVLPVLLEPGHSA